MNLRLSSKKIFLLIPMILGLVLFFQNCSGKKDGGSEAPAGPGNMKTTCTGDCIPKVNSFTMLNAAGGTVVYPGETARLYWQTTNADYVIGRQRITGTCQSPIPNWVDWSYLPAPANQDGKFVGTHDKVYTSDTDRRYENCVVEVCLTAYNWSNEPVAPGITNGVSTACTSYSVPVSPRVTELVLQPNVASKYLLYGWNTTNATSVKGMFRAKQGTCNGIDQDWGVWQNGLQGQLNPQYANFNVPNNLEGCTYEYCITALTATYPNQAAKTVNSANSKCGDVNYNIFFPH